MSQCVYITADEYAEYRKLIGLPLSKNGTENGINSFKNNIH